MGESDMSDEPRIIRLFPRKTRATPTDPLAYFGPPDRHAEADEVHVSVTFTYDKAWADHLAEQWRHVAPVKVGGPAYGDRGEQVVPGRYVKPGYIFTSRGCPRRCWFCSVWKRDPVPRLLPIVAGWNILDDNLPACPRDHVEAVFAMLRRQNRRIEFTGGLEALSLHRRSHPQVLGACAVTPHLKAPASLGPGNSWLVFEKELDDALDVSAKAGDEVGARLDENKIPFSALNASILPALAQIVSTSELGLAMGTAHATKSLLCVHSADK